MALVSNDLFIVERGGVKYKMTASQIADFIGAVRDYTASNIAARDALSGLKVGDRVFVVDASADATVDTGWAMYRVASIGPNVFTKLQEQEGQDLVIDANAADLSYNPSTRVVSNTNGTGFTLPNVDGTNSGLATPAMFTYGNQQETFTTGSHSCDSDGFVYIQKESTGRSFRFDIGNNILTSLSTNVTPNGAVLVGNRMFILPYTEGGTEIHFLYTIIHTSPILNRCLLV